MKVEKKHFFMGVVLFFSLFFIFQVFAQNIDNGQTDKYLVETIFLPDGRIIEGRILPGPPTPPEGFERASVILPEPNLAAGINALTVPAFSWSFGCTATSAAMIAGYYDRTGYSNMYTGPTNGGVMPMDNSSWSDWVDSHGDTRHQCPLSATHLGLDGRATKGHVDDYWIYYDQPGPDPWVGNWTEHTYGDCTGDFMKTNQWFASEGFNTDGATTYYYFTDGSPLYASDIESYSLDPYDGPYGFKLFYESRGYTVTNMYNQLIKGQGSNPALGFTYAQYCSEIDAGRPVMIHLAGHTIVGVGYDDSSNLVYVHDTWDYSTYTMTWGSTYSGMQHIAVSIVSLESSGEKKFDPNGDGYEDILWRHYLTGLNAVWYMFYSSEGITGLSLKPFEMLDMDKGLRQTEIIQDPMEVEVFPNEEVEVFPYKTEVEVLRTPIEEEDLVYEIEEYEFDRTELGDTKGIEVLAGPGDRPDAEVSIQGLTRTATTYLTTVPDTSWHIVGTGDFNGDKKADILWRNYANGLNAVWYMNGVTRTATVYLTTVTDTNWHIAGTCDVNGDGKVDILWRHYSSGLNAVWYMDGVTRTATVYLTTVTDTNWHIVGTVDSTGTGNVFILWRHYSSGLNAVWFMSRATRTATAYLTTVTDTNWNIVGTGDFNRDGHVDILWRNYANGLNAVWYMNGITRTATEYLTTVTDTNWKIENR